MKQFFRVKGKQKFPALFRAFPRSVKRVPAEGGSVGGIDFGEGFRERGADDAVAVGV